MASMSQAAAAAELLRRRRARSSFHDFVLYVRRGFKDSNFARDVCRQLDRFLDDVIAGKRPVLVLKAPPQHGKSELVSRLFPAYVFGRFPKWHVGNVSYAIELARGFSRDVQNIMLGAEYRALFPKSSLAGKKKAVGRVDLRQTATEFDIPGEAGEDGGDFRAVGIGGPLTGRPLDLGIVDDPIKNSKEALSPVVKKGHWDWFQSTLSTRMSENSGRIIMATAWAEDDLMGMVEKELPNVRVEAYEAIDPVTGLALAPELHSLEQLEEIKAALSDYWWSAMYRSSPKPIGGNVFKDVGIRYYLPEGSAVLRLPGAPDCIPLPAKFEKMIQSWDMTFKDTDGSDYVAGHVWGKVGANSFLLDRVNDRLSFTASKAAVQAMTRKWPQARRKLIEDKANGPAIIDSLKAKISGIVPVEPDGSKVARAHAVTAEWEAGNIYLPHPSIAPWVKDLVGQITTFPAAANDDDVDAMTQALRDLYSRGRGFFG